MNNIEIAKRIRRILYNSREVYDSNGHIDYASNYTIVIGCLTELLLEILNVPE